MPRVGRIVLWSGTALFALTAAGALGCRALAAQSLVQLPSINNLEHAADYQTGPGGVIEKVVRMGTGPIDVLLIPGWGFGAEVFERFMTENAIRYRMVAISIPGFGGTRAPPMPDSGTSYGEATWTRAAEEAIARLIVSEGLVKPVIIGHFVVGTQIALRLAIDHPDLVSGVVIVGGEPFRPTPSRRDTTGRTPADLEERVAGIDRWMAPMWFKTVSPETWHARNYAAAQYAVDSARAAQLWQQSARVPIPVMVRYLCEYMASDISIEYSRIRVPVRVLRPSFSEAILADTAQSYVRPFFIDSWASAPSANALIVVRNVPNSRIFVTDDQPAAVTGAISEILQ
jgi:pimeloyl-ACP methyl ester carboxylesterase